jgi:hypothetical protein
MANSLTFDPSAGTPVAVNLTINSGADFVNDFTVRTTSGTPFDFSGAGTTWTGSSQLAKSISIGSSSYAVATFNVGFTSAAGGKFQISLGSTQTRTLNEGRYVYDVLVSSGSTVYRIVDGNIIVKPGISSAP